MKLLRREEPAEIQIVSENHETVGGRFIEKATQVAGRAGC